MRDNVWLEKRLAALWGKHFNDVPQANEIKIYFGRKAKKRLGSIREELFFAKRSQTHIKLNGHYQNVSVPDFVVDATIAHELCHYTHGFSSPLPQIFDHPHKGDIVDEEMIKRGLGDTLLLQRDWLEKNWNETVKHEVFKK